MEQKIKRSIITDLENMVSDAAKSCRKDCTFENRILYAMIKKPNMSLEDACYEVASLFRHRETNKSLLYVLKRLGYVPEFRRNEFFGKASEIAGFLVQCLSSGKVDDDRINEIEKYLDQEDFDIRITKRMVLLYIYRLIPELADGPSFKDMIKCGRVFCNECVDNIISYIKIELSNPYGMADYEKEIKRLEAEIKRKNTLLVRLQEDFDVRIEENRKEDAENLIVQLNSEKYGYILDMLTNLTAGMKTLRREKKIIPIEINSIQSLVRQLLRFVDDCGITTILEMGEELTIDTDTVKHYQYSGTPFENAQDKKKVRVVSTGWEIKEKEIVISQPAVQECEKE